MPRARIEAVTLLSTCSGTDDAGKRKLLCVAAAAVQRDRKRCSALCCRPHGGRRWRVFAHELEEAAARLAAAAAAPSTASLQTLAKLSSLEPPARADRRNKKITASVALQIYTKCFA